ncbi:spermidine synthase [Legionella micdadei]|uniref:Methyltransferase domain-containing protein n=1 Tax=Legionella micdadei TaxID=451 RepID=A0A098GGS3_LEGMI|nr:hypothetical protein [Legionella micdadei]ARG97346.1 hypothetical protein B6N58_06545 [Legionella micdadei]ARH00346.1 hypothetical protein B6V88_07875 [Legionella micdadei]KTD28231.1 spermidine synthase [Legionella micdadei]NSL16860.1 hypothetical protein [Legionella micdadei]CEG61182.1 conserved protein of unknown function [Legionella micdadei]
MWKTFAGHCIYQSTSGIRVFQNPIFRWLQFDSRAIQTLINRYCPQKPGLSYIKSLIFAVTLQPESCCMLGLGGGGAAHALSPLLGKDKLVIVERDDEVIDVASRFFMINQLENLSIIHQEANLFIRECQTQFQHLLVDLFDANAFPTSCNNDEFFLHCKRLLKPGGILAVNLANRHEQWPIFQLIQKSFQRSTIVLPVLDSPNMIVLAQNSDSMDTLLNRLKKNKTCKKITWDSKWGCVAKIK